jgi:hypothetical protein
MIGLGQSRRLSDLGMAAWPDSGRMAADAENRRFGQYPKSRQYNASLTASLNLDEHHTLSSINKRNPA